MTANGGEIKARLVLNNSEFKQKMNETREDMKRTSFSAQQMNKDFGIIQKGSAVMGAAILAAVGSSVKAAANLEQNMANIKSVTNATDEEMKRLESTAREWAAQTKYSADETSNALFELSKAGFSVNEQIDALPAVLAGATAGNIDLAQSAGIVSNVMRTFKIPAEEVSTAIDILAQTANSANTDIPGIAEGLKYVGPVAQSVGWDLAQTSAALGLLADHGIEASQGGTVLRASLLALANPTGQTTKAMKDLNIEVLDADGNMKSLPDLMGHISTKMEGMTSAQKTQAAAQLVGTQAAAGFISLLEVGEEGLADYVKELENSEGAAQRMADIQSDTLNGAFKEFQSVLQEAGIKLGQEFLPEFKNLVSYGSDVVRTLSDVDMSTVKAGIAFGGTATSIALTASTIGKLALAAKGIFAAMGPAGWMIIGASVLGGAIAALNVHMKESKEVNFELADSLSEQADVLEDNVNQFDELQGKSKLTTDEFGRMIDIQKELSETQDPGKIEALQKEYDRLREKSGLSNDEIDTMIGLNSDIIEQSPKVETALSDKGEAVVKSTEAVREFIQSLRDMSLEELRIEQAKAFDRRNELLEENKQLVEEITTLDERMNQLVEARNIPLEEVDARLEEIQRKMDTGLLTQEEYNVLEEEQSVLLTVQNGLVGESLQAAQDKKKELMETLELNEEELAQLDAVNQKIAEAHLKEVDINWEKGKGLEKLDDEIEALTKKRDKIKENLTQEEKLNGLYDEELEALDAAISKHEGKRDIIKEETGYQSEANKKKEQGNAALGKQNRFLIDGKHNVQNIGKQQDSTNRKIGAGTKEAQKMNEELKKDAKKEVDVDDKGKAQKIHDKAKEPATKKVTVWESVKKWWNSNKEERHQGGVVGTPTRGNQLPKYHTGGVVRENPLTRSNPFIAANPIGIDTEESREKAKQSVALLQKLTNEKGDYSL